MGRKLIPLSAKEARLHASCLQHCRTVQFNVHHYYQWIIHVSNCFLTAEKIRNAMEIDTKYRLNPPCQEVFYLF